MSFSLSITRAPQVADISKAQGPTVALITEVPKEDKTPSCLKSRLIMRKSVSFNTDTDIILFLAHQMIIQIRSKIKSIKTIKNNNNNNNSYTNKLRLCWLQYC